MNKFITIIVISISLFSCEDPIDVNLGQSKEQLIVEALVNDSKDTQSIYLSKSLPYFDKRKKMPPVENARIAILSEKGKVFVFNHFKNGQYIFVPNTTDTFINGQEYNLGIHYKNDTFVSTSRLNFPAIFDSLTYKYNSKDDVAAWDEGYFVTMHIKDRKGVGDNYWIKTYRNGIFKNSSNDINTSLDGQSGNSSIQDGEDFGFDVRFFGQNNFDSAYTIDEEVKIDVLTISYEFRYFLQLIQAQLNNEGMFQSPPANIPTNVVNINKNKKNVKAVGFFSMAALASKKITIK